VAQPRSRRVLANDFAAQWEEIRADAQAALERVGQSGRLVLGEEVRLFEDRLADWWGVDHAVGVASGLDALEIALRCAGVGPGDRVVTTPLTAFATTLAILRAGAEPVWCDVDSSGALDLTAASDAIAGDGSIRAVVPVHLYGHPMDPVALAAVGARHGIAVIEDCAQSAGARRASRPTGCAGAIAATSLYPTKNLGAMGDGGVLLTDDAGVAERARMLRNYGQQRQHHHVERGLNSRLDEVHAAILRSALLPRLDDWLDRRSAVAARYAEALAGSLLQPIGPTGGVSSNHLFAVEIIADADPETCAEQLTAAGVSIGRHYPVLCPDQPACESVGVVCGDLPVARRIARRELSLPLHPQLDDGAVDHVIAACLALAA